LYQNVASAMVIVAATSTKNATTGTTNQVNYKGELSLTLVQDIMNNCNKDDCPALCEGIITVDGVISESDGSTEMMEETYEAVESDPETQDEEAEEVNIAGRRLATAYTANVAFTATGASSISLGDDSGVSSTVTYDDVTTAEDTDDSHADQTDDEEDDGANVLTIGILLIAAILFSNW